MKIKRKRIFAVLMAALMTFAITGCSKSNTDTASKDSKEFDTSVYKNNDYLITPQGLDKLLKSKEVVLLDCNKPDVYAKEHIPGAVSIGIQAFSDKSGKIGDANWGTIMSKEKLTSALEALGVDNKTTVVLYSDLFKGPGADGRALWQLQQAGLTNVKLLVGGTTYWKELGYQVTTEVTKATPKSGVVLKDYDLTNSAKKDYVYSNLGKEVIIDVRTKAEFDGSQNAGEPRGGHIKGAVNLLWTDLLNKNGTPKSPKEITDMMASLGVKPGDTFVVY
ncbi:MAG: sulfurtransferase [Solirubrobacterales bacterium]